MRQFGILVSSFSRSYVENCRTISDCSKAASIKNALSETKRVLKDEGRLVVMVWSNKKDFEAASYLKVVGSLLPRPPPGAPSPFALSENQLLKKMLEEQGLPSLIIRMWYQYIMRYITIHSG